MNVKIAWRWATALMVAGLGISPGKASPPEERLAWRGREFRCVFTNGMLFPGSNRSMAVDDVVRTSRGLYCFTSRGGRRGSGEVAVDYLAETGWQTVTTGAGVDYGTTLSMSVVGVNELGDLLFQALATDRVHPLYRWNGTLSSFATLPEGATNALFHTDRLTYSLPLDPSGPRVLQRLSDGSTEVLLTSTEAPGLGHHIASDGSTLAYRTGSSTNYALWLRRPDGSRARILGEGDLLPSTTVQASVLPTPANTVVDRGWVYALVVQKIVGRPGREGIRQVLLRANGVETQVLLSLQDPVLGMLGGEKLADFALQAVQDGQVFVRSTVAGRVSIHQWEEGTWTRVISSTNSLDGLSISDLGMYRNGVLGDRIVLKATVFSDRLRTQVQLYVNGPIEAAAPGALRVGLARAAAPEQDAQLIIEGFAGLRHTVEHSTDLKLWKPLASVDLGASGRSNLVLRQDASVGFYRVQMASGTAARNE